MKIILNDVILNIRDFFFSVVKTIKGIPKWKLSDIQLHDLLIHAVKQIVYKNVGEYSQGFVCFSGSKIIFILKKNSVLHYVNIIMIIVQWQIQHFNLWFELKMFGSIASILKDYSLLFHKLFHNQQYIKVSSIWGDKIAVYINIHKTLTFWNVLKTCLPRHDTHTENFKGPNSNEIQRKYNQHFYINWKNMITTLYDCNKDVLWPA